MSFFTFNGISSDELGLILTETPLRPSWLEETEEIVIPGRPQKLKRRSGVYGNQQLTVQAVISDTAPDKLRRIYDVLSGHGILVLSTAPEECLECDADVLVPKSVALTMAELTVSFDCCPFARALEPATVTFGGSYTKVTNTGTVYSEPLIEIHVAQDSAPVLMGDVNFDGVVDAVDVSMVMAEYSRIATGGEPTFTPEQKAAADMNGDGVIDSVDASLIMQKYIEAQTGGKRHDTPIVKELVLYTNGEALTIGLPAAVPQNGYTVYVDSFGKKICYINGEGKEVNILHLSLGDLPLLSVGDNYIKVVGDITDAKITLNERWK